LSSDVNECNPLLVGDASAVVRRGILAQLCVLRGVGFAGVGQGLIIVHFPAQPMPFWSQLPVPPGLIDWGDIMQPRYRTQIAYVEPRSGRV
jgi:hypothetical protein